MAKKKAPAAFAKFARTMKLSAGRCSVGERKTALRKVARGTTPEVAISSTCTRSGLSGVGKRRKAKR